MNADREPNRLPLRAGAMMLFAVAVVFIGLGWHSAATSGSEPEAETTATATSTPTSATPSSTSASASAKRVCVINAGQVSGLASDVTDLLKEKGYTMAQPGNYTAGGFSENTIFYDEDSDKAQADQLADALGGTVSVEERPSSFTRCRGGLPVIVVTAVSGS
ncbi:LytR C-terminal domain-containing protein [Gordonia amicalis]|uniref:LytR C-terminal domain-containing protein n=1 Tax=Gordonia amicalis TaxID=89053 RepID=A0AAE4R5J5_9ACTN|nr:MULTISPECIES: LytR C-terminal domain-containing protein [Gordonia]MBA5845787.1 LytR C-terminal domain-containing protein [Gordonia amicalis]MCZ4581755.1 LytR C-terminal domain-containing protein [Gordonia amicalis]MCZ4650167.1 LytR C-terminal domain-containing protein [Gordonia amicalis]MDV6313865.1 LytR C-terminal domain-containing protein [Gordonia amicalis]MDV7102374.1 LytR C-terminal domain-containing protein [Gordonia amicalis]